MRLGAQGLKVRPYEDDIAAMANDTNRPALGRVLVERGVISEEHLARALAIQRSGGGLLGEILTNRGWVSPLSIAAALARQREESEVGPLPQRSAEVRASPGETWKPLGTILIEKGCITDVELKQALAIKQEQGGFIGEVLVERGWLSSSDLVLGLAAQLGLDYDLRRSKADGILLPTDRPDPHFEVLEERDGTVLMLKKAASFMEATDFVFDEVLWEREPGNLQIVRVDAGPREVVWTFKPGETNVSAPAGDDLLSIFGYPVTNWQGPEYLYDGERADGPARQSPQPVT